jgi:lysophospholipase L1-like esterase
MSDPSYQRKVYIRQGGDEMVVASGGRVVVEPGGAIDGMATVKSYGAVDDGATDCAAAFALGFAAVDELIVPAGSYSASSLTVPTGKTLVLQRGAYLQVTGTTISVQGQIRTPSAILGPPGLCGAIGDSRAQGATWTYPGTSIKTIDSLFYHSELRTKGALLQSIPHAKGAASSLTTALDTQITSLFAESVTPSYCYILSGTNDAVDVTAAEQVRRFVNAWLRLLGKGIVPIHIADLPRQQSGYTAARASRNRQCQDRLAVLADAIGVVFIDPVDLMTDYSTSAGDPLAANYNADLVHQNPVGNWAMAGRIATALSGKLQIPAMGYLAPTTNASVYHATNNPNGNSWTNAQFIGTAGSVSSGVTGEAPTGYTASRSFGSSTTATSAVVARADGVPGNWWECTVSSASGLHEFALTASLLAGVAGQTVIASVDIDCSGLTGNANAILWLDQTGAAATTAIKVGQNTGTKGGSPAAYSGRVSTGAFLLAAGTTSCRVRLVAQFTDGHSGVIRFGNPYFAILP